MSLFFEALQAARNGTVGEDIPGYLAQVTISVENAEQRYDMGIKRLTEWLKTEPSTDELGELLPVWGEFFNYVF